MDLKKKYSSQSYIIINEALSSKEQELEINFTKKGECSSMYKPNTKLLKKFPFSERFDVKTKAKIKTKTLDNVLKMHGLMHPNYMKLDIQGAELEALKWSVKSLKSICCIELEIEFAELYENQPLFGDVSNFLTKYDFMFNKFLGLAGRTLRPLIANNDPNIASQHMWSDAVFIRHVEKIKDLKDEKLLKLSLLSAIYNSLDLAYFCLLAYDKRNKSSLAKDWISF